MPQACASSQALVGLNPWTLTPQPLPLHPTQSWFGLAPCPTPEEEGTSEQGLGALLSQVKPAAYLNFLADLLHNFSDGLALGVSFGRGHGLSTTMVTREGGHDLPKACGCACMFVGAWELLGGSTLS